MVRNLHRLLLIVFLLHPALAFSQTDISGTVTDRNTGEPLPGTNVVLQETQVGAAADSDGNYTIPNVQPGVYTLVAQFIGYTRFQEQIEVGTTPVTIDIELGPDFMGLEEVVVTALGIERERRSIGYAVQSVSGDDLLEARTPNIVNSLSGRVAGIQVTSSSGQPGQGSRVVLRGHSSMLGNNQPLFVVDGVPISNQEDRTQGDNILFTGGGPSRSLDIDPSIIEDVTVLKGASATALYGSRAANGAIIITTRSGDRAQLRPQVSYSTTIGTQSPIIDGYQTSYLQGLGGLFRNGLPEGRGGYNENPDGPTQGTTSWGPHRDSVSAQVLQDLGVDAIPVVDPRRQFYRNGASVDNAISLSGATEATNYMLSVSNSNQSGIVPNTDLNRTSILARFGARFGDNLDVSSSVNYVNTQNTWQIEGNTPRSYFFTLMHAPISFDLQPATFEDGTDRIFMAGRNNPYWLVNHNARTSDINRFIGSTAISYQILPWLTITERLGIDTYADLQTETYDVGTATRLTGTTRDQTITRTEINSDLLLTADLGLTGNLSANIILGNNINTRTFKREWMEGVGLNQPGFFHITSANITNADDHLEKRRIASVFSTMTLDYNDYVYLTLTGRNDWSSTLPIDANSYFYPSASLGLVFTDAFNINPRILPFGKLRASVGLIGNDAPIYATSTAFQRMVLTDAVRGEITYPFRGVNAYRIDTELGNAALRPERTLEYEVGIDLTLLDGRAGIDVSYYDRSTRDQIFAVPVSGASGFLDVLENAGEIRNSGIEIMGRLVPIRGRNFNWSMQLNYGKNVTEVVELAEGVASIYLSGFTDPQVRIMPERHGYGVIWSADRFLRDDDGNIMIDDGGLPINARSGGPIGNVQPDWTGGFRNVLSYRGLSLSALVDIRRGGDVLNMDLFYTTFYGTAGVTEQRNTETVWEGMVLSTCSIDEGTGEIITGTCDPNTTAVMQDQDYFLGHYSSIFDNFVEDGSFVKLREVNLGYSLPRSLLAASPFEGVHVSVSGRNLYTWTNFSYGDPEGSLYGSGNGQGFYHGVTPGTRSYAFNMRFTF